MQPTLWLVWNAHMHNSPSLTDLSPFNPKRNFCSKILKLRELFAFYTSRKFTLSTKQHYFTENRQEEKKNLIRRKSDLIKLHFNLTPRSLKRTFEQFSYLLPLKIFESLGHPRWGILANFEHKCWPRVREVWTMSKELSKGYWMWGAWIRVFRHLESTQNSQKLELTKWRNKRNLNKRCFF